MLRKAEGGFTLAAIAAVFLTASGFQGKGGSGTTPPPIPEIVFSNAGIKVMNADGTNVRTVVPLGRGESADYPCWGPTGTNLVFGGVFSGQGTGVYAVNLDGANRRKVTSTSTYVLPKWSAKPGPNGQNLIAYTDYGPIGSIGNQRDVFVVNPDGTGKLNVTNTPDEYESYCTWSRDGSRLYFTRGSSLMAANLGLDGSGNVVVLSEEVQWDEWGVYLTQIEAANTTNEVVYCTNAGNSLRLHILDLSVSPPGKRMVTLSSSSDERFPSYSPDDGKIVFHRGGTSGGIFTVNADGTGETRILAGSTKGFAPHWKRPAPPGS